MDNIFTACSDDIYIYIYIYIYIHTLYIYIYIYIGRFKIRVPKIGEIRQKHVKMTLSKT